MPRSPSDGEFTQFAHASWASLYRTAYLLIGDAAEAEDLVQTTLAKTYASWSKVRDVDAAPGYARTVLVNTATSWFRKRSWRNERPTAEPPDLVHEPDPSDRPALMSALAVLPPRQRAVIVLRYYEDLTEAETADMLGITVGTVKSQAHKALAALRASVGDHPAIDRPMTDLNRQEER
jgi:RNA polymerase sigma-70 factor (sigma-E family)